MKTINILTARDIYVAYAAAERIVNALRIELWHEAPLSLGWQKAHNIRQYLDRQAQGEWEGDGLSNRDRASLLG